jgi:hypothetical protein
MGRFKVYQKYNNIALKSFLLSLIQTYKRNKIVLVDIKRENNLIKIMQEIQKGV